MKEVMSLVERFASSDATVLILGETGVGKDVVARLTHELSPRKEKMFLKVDCGGISESLTESELFGYMPGAFTGAGNTMLMLQLMAAVVSGVFLAGVWPVVGGRRF